MASRAGRVRQSICGRSVDEGIVCRPFHCCSFIPERKGRRKKMVSVIVSSAAASPHNVGLYNSRNLYVVSWYQPRQGTVSHLHTMSNSRRRNDFRMLFFTSTAIRLRPQLFLVCLFGDPVSVPWCPVVGQWWKINWKGLGRKM
jgi:hypothetical protein